MRSQYGVTVGRTDGSDADCLSQCFHGARAQDLHLVTRAAPLEAPRLAVHVASHHRAVIYAAHHFQVCAMHIDGIIHHALVQSVHRLDASLATREMGGIGLCAEEAGVVHTLQAHAEMGQFDVLTQVCQQAHALGVMHLHLAQHRVHIVAQEEAGSRTGAHTEHCHRTGLQARIFPLGGSYQPRFGFLGTIQRNGDVARVVHHMACVAVKGKAKTIGDGPSFIVGLKTSVLAAVLHPGSGVEQNALLRIVLHNLHL